MDNIKIIREADDPTGGLRKNAISYRCNCCGELTLPGEEDATEDMLPEALRRAYRALWKEEAVPGASCCLVETEDGCGIALVGSYAKDVAYEMGMDMSEYLDVVIRDAEILAAREELWCSHIYVLDSAEKNPEAHILAVVLPANMPKRDFEAACKAVQSDLYGTEKKLREEARRQHLIDLAIQHVLEFHESVGDTDIKIGRTSINKTEDKIDVEISFSWRLNAWDKHVQKTDILVKDSFGYWNLVNGFGTGRFQE